MLLFLFFLGFQQPEVVKHTLQPWDIQDPENNALFGSVSLLATDEQYLYIVSQPGPEILIFKKDGSFVNRLYRKGEGPNDFGFNVFGLAAENGLLWAVGSKPRANLVAVDGTDLGNIRLEAFNVELQFMPHRLAMDVERSILVTPAWPRSGALGLAYHFDGRILHKIDKPLALPERRYMANKGSSDTMWARDGEYWYCAFKYHPEIRKYDSNFEPVAVIKIDDYEIGSLLERHEDILDEGKHPSALIHDFTVNKGRIYVLAARGMYELSANTGEIIARHFFYLPGMESDDPGKPRLTLNRIASLDDHTIALGHSHMMWDHDLWRITLPERQ